MFKLKNSLENKFLNEIKELNTILIDKTNKIKDIEIFISKIYDNELVNESNEFNDFQKIKQEILNHRSKEELQKIENRKSKYVSLQEHIDAEKIYKIRLNKHVNDILIPGIQKEIQLLQIIQTDIETIKNNLIKSRKSITNKSNKFTLSESSKLSKQNSKKFDNVRYTNIDDLFTETLNYLTKVINYAESINKFYTSGNYKLFLSPTQIELQREKTEKFIKQFNTSNLNIDNKSIELLDVEDVYKMNETDKMKFLLNYNTSSFGTFKMKREGNNAYKYLYDLNDDVLVNSIYIANLLNLNPDFKFNYVKDKSLIKDVSKVDSNNLVMFLPKMDKNQLTERKMYNNKFYTINTIDDYQDDIKNLVKDLLHTYQTYIEERNYGLEEVLKSDEERFGIKDSNNPDLKNTLLSREKLIKKYIETDKKVNDIFKLDTFYSENNTELINQGKCPNIGSYEDIPTKDDCDIFDTNPNNYPLLIDFLIDKDLKPFEQNENTLRKKNPVPKDRQYVFGSDKEKKYFEIRKCSYFFHKSPFINKINTPNVYVNPNIFWNLKYNISLTYCIKNSNLLFPLRYIIPDTNTRYDFYKKENNLNFIGNIIIPFNDNRKNVNSKIIKHKTQTFILNVFYKDKLIYLYNDKSSILYEGFIFGGINVVYTELYFAIQKWNMYPYLYIPNKNDKDNIKNLSSNILFLSTYNPKKLFNELINSEYKNSILDRIQPVNIIFPKRGGYIQIIKSDFKIYKGGNIFIPNKNILFKTDNISYTNNIKFKDYIDIYDKIYPYEYYLKLLEKEKDIKNKINNIEIYNIEIYNKKLFNYSFIYKHTGLSSLSSNYKFNLNNIINKNYNILYYNFDSSSSVASLEVLINNNLILENTNMLFFSKHMFFLEAYQYQYLKIYKKIKIDAYYLKYYLKQNKKEEIFKKYENKNKNLSNKSKSIIKKIYNTIINDITCVLSYNYIQEHFKEKYNFFYADLPIFPYLLNIILKEQINQQLFISLVLIMINTLEKGGNALFLLPSIKTKLTTDIIFILSQLFETFYFYNTEIRKSDYDLYIYDYIVCKNYKGYNKDIAEIISNVLKELDKIDPSGGLNFNVLNEDKRKELGITKEITKNTPIKYLKSFLKFNKKKIQPFYDHIKQYNTDKLSNLYNNLNNIENYARNIKDHPEIDKELKEYQLFNSITYANRLGLRIKKDINVDTFSNFFGKELLQDMFILDEGIRFKFNKDKNLTAVVKKCTTPLSIFFEKIKIDMKQSNTVIDTRDPEKYEQVKKMTKLYQTSLGYYLKSIGISYNNINVNRGWTKMYEMLHTIPELVGNKIAVKSFHLCDAPGGFILATEFFLKKKNATLNWKAQSLNPNELINIKKYGKILNDDFGILKQFPERWIWGKDNTGDISNPENIKFYSEHCKDVDLMTSDCGIDFGARDEFLEKINYSQFLFMFNNLPKGGNCLLKVFSPISSQKISILYLFYSRFKKMFFYKPMQNPSSEEFYIIGINYENPLNQEELNIMFDVLNNYNSEECLVDNIPEYFILQLESIMRKLADNYDRSIEKKIYYLDNLDKITKEHIKDLNKTILRKNKEFAEEMGLID
jgi:hypothetical protein